MEYEILRGSVREKVIALILTGRLKPGERIKELALSQILNVSRTPLREALISLEKEGIVCSEPNIGFKLKTMSVKEAEELYPLIALLENYALHLAFPLITTQIKELENINENFYRKRKSSIDASLIDCEFHSKLTELCRNETLLQMIANLRLRISCYEHFYMAKSEQIEQSHQQHQDIIKAIKEGNEEMAKSILVDNWEIGRRFIITELTQEENRLKK